MLTLSPSHKPSLFRRHTVGGEVGVAVEAQHAGWVRGRSIMAAHPCWAQHVDGGDYGRKLWHTAWPQLYVTQTHHQPVPHRCHPPLLEHAAWVIYTPATRHKYTSTSWNAAWLIVWFCFIKETYFSIRFYSVIKHKYKMLFWWYLLFKSWNREPLAVGEIFKQNWNLSE